MPGVKIPRDAALATGCRRETFCADDPRAPLMRSTVGSAPEMCLKSENYGNRTLYVHIKSNKSILRHWIWILMALWNLEFHFHWTCSKFTWSPSYPFQSPCAIQFLSGLRCDDSASCCSKEGSAGLLQTR